MANQGKLLNNKKLPCIDFSKRLPWPVEICDWIIKIYFYLFYCNFAYENRSCEKGTTLHMYGFLLLLPQKIGD
jgi:hypothetical protein